MAALVLQKRHYDLDTLDHLHTGTEYPFDWCVSVQLPANMQETPKTLWMNDLIGAKSRFLVWVCPLHFQCVTSRVSNAKQFNQKIQTKFLANNLRKHWELQQDSGCNKVSTQESWNTNACVPPSLFIVNLTGMNELGMKSIIFSTQHGVNWVCLKPTRAPQGWPRTFDSKRPARRFWIYLFFSHAGWLFTIVLA